jgi:hypothetical protein
VNYALGAQVIYSSTLYQCIQAHTSNSSWTPSSQPTLWQSQGRCSGGGGLVVSLVQGMQSTKTMTLTPTLTVTATKTVSATPTADTLVKSIIAAPNVSRNGLPIQFHINLYQPAQITISLFTVLGEEVYQTTKQGTSGDNQIVWRLRNKAENTVGTGLYICVVQVNNGIGVSAQTSKVVVLH